MRLIELTSDDGDALFEMANLPQAETGVEGVVYVSTRVSSHAPRVKWYAARPGRRVPCLSVTIEDDPKVFNNNLPDHVVRSVQAAVIEFVRLNKDSLMDFWNNGETWLTPEVDRWRADLKKV